MGFSDGDEVETMLRCGFEFHSWQSQGLRARRRVLTTREMSADGSQSSGFIPLQTRVLWNESAESSIQESRIPRSSRLFTHQGEDLTAAELYEVSPSIKAHVPQAVSSEN